MDYPAFTCAVVELPLFETVSKHRNQLFIHNTAQRTAFNSKTTKSWREEDAL
jgi:hypothetical protein